jgi:phosphonate transport system substrate-binding protein
MRLFRNIATFLCVALLTTVVLSDCSNKHKTEAAPANAPEAKDTFVIALLPERNVFVQKRRYEPLAQYLSKHLDMNVRTRLLDSYAAVYAQMLDRRVNAAFFGSLSYLVMHSRMPLDPIARPVLRNGRSSYSGVIFALKGGGITEDIATWRGRRIALIDKSTTSGYLFPKWYLWTKGVRNLHGFFRKVLYAGSYDAAIAEVMDGRSDIGCSNADILNNFLNQNPLMREKLVILAKSPPFPSSTLGVREDIDPALERKLSAALLGMDKTDEGRRVLAEFGAKRFIETSESEYDSLGEMLKTIGIRPADIALEAVGGRGRAAAGEPGDESR